MPGFDEATDVHPRPGGTDLDATLDPDWTVAGRPNGGYLLAVLARAAATVVVAGGGDHPDPLAVSGTYLQPPSPGPAVVRAAGGDQDDDAGPAGLQHPAGRLAGGVEGTVQVHRQALPPHLVRVVGDAAA